MATAKKLNLNNVSIETLEKELKQRKTVKIAALQKERSKIETEIQKLSSVDKTKKSMKRTANGKSLTNYILDVAADKEVRSPTKFIADLKTAGWITKSENPYVMVSNALTSLIKKDLMEKISKGNYKIK